MLAWPDQPGPCTTILHLVQGRRVIVRGRTYSDARQPQKRPKNRTYTGCCYLSAREEIKPEAVSTNLPPGVGMRTRSAATNEGPACAQVHIQTALASRPISPDANHPRRERGRGEPRSRTGSAADTKKDEDPSESPSRGDCTCVPPIGGGRGSRGKWMPASRGFGSLG
jgi:hypothetical protein